MPDMLRQLAAEVVGLNNALAEPQPWRCESRLRAEQPQSELALLERTHDRAQKFALPLAKLDLARSALRGGDGEPRPVHLVVKYVNDWRQVVDGALLLEMADPLSPPAEISELR